jgi:hypothetical protein
MTHKCTDGRASVQLLGINYLEVQSVEVRGTRLPPYWTGRTIPSVRQSREELQEIAIPFDRWVIATDWKYPSQRGSNMWCLLMWTENRQIVLRRTDFKVLILSWKTYIQLAKKKLSAFMKSLYLSEIYWPKFCMHFYILASSLSSSA